MQTDQEMVDRISNFFPSMKPAATQRTETANDKLIAEGKATGVPLAAMPDEVIGERMYGHDAGEGAPVADYLEHGVNSFFESHEIEARNIKDDAELSALAEAKTAVNQAFIDLQVGPVRAREVMTLARDYATRPRGDQDIQTLTDNTYSGLKKEFGSRTDEAVRAAQRVVSELSRKVPRFREAIDSGLGSDPVFVRMALNAARKKGYF